jgi:hypothetical protein
MTTTCTCQSCGKRFEAARADAAYCSNACRHRAFRERSGPEPTLTAAERRELAALIRRREAVAKSDAKRQAAERLAEFEERLAAEYKVDDPRWRDVTHAAQRAVAEADDEVARICREVGIPEEFRPALNVSWYGRGENAMKQRRAELRRVAEARIDAMEKAARPEIERMSVDAQTAVVRDGLGRPAKAFLESLPMVEEMLPALSVGEVEEVAQIESRERW